MDATLFIIIAAFVAIFGGGEAVKQSRRNKDDKK